MRFVKISFVAVRLVEKRFVEVAFVVVELVAFSPAIIELMIDSFEANRFVVVADVPVAFWNVKFARVEEAFTKRFVVEAVPKIVRP